MNIPVIGYLIFHLCNAFRWLFGMQLLTYGPDGEPLHKYGLYYDPPRRDYEETDR